MRVLVVVLAVAALAGCSSGSDETADTTQPRPVETSTNGGGGAADGGLGLERVVTGLDAPLYVATAPGETSPLYVVLQGGEIVVVEDGSVRPEPFLDIRDEVTSGGEQGLLSLAFDPDYRTNRRLYVDYTNVDGDTRVVQYRSTADGRRVDESTARVLLAVDQPYANHNGGQLEFGPDGRLWVGMGDGGSGGDPENRAQDLGQPLGKLLALDVDAARPEPSIRAYGLRNPWRFSFDRATEDLWIGDVGESEWEEVDVVPRDRLGELSNLGWDALEGKVTYEDKEPNAAGHLVGPLAVYSHDEGCSITGGYVYRGESIPAARGRYFYGDYCSGGVWSLARGGGPRREPFTVEGLSSFGEDARGELYLVSLQGTVFRLVGS